MRHIAFLFAVVLAFVLPTHSQDFSKIERAELREILTEFRTARAQISAAERRLIALLQSRVSPAPALP